MHRAKVPVKQCGKMENSDIWEATIWYAVGGMGGVTLSCVCPHCNSFPLEDSIWWVSNGHGDGNNSKKKQCSWWCAVCGGKYEWRAPNRILVVQLGINAIEAKIFKAHAASSCWRTSRRMVTARVRASSQAYNKGAEKKSWTGQEVSSK